MPLQLVGSYKLPSDIKGHFDHIVVDAKGKRLFATPEDYHAVLVISTETGKLIHQIGGIEKPHAILYRPDLNLLYITDGEDGSVKVFDAVNYKLEHRIPLLKDADSIGYDPGTHYLYVDNGGGDVGQKYSMLSVIDTNKFAKVDDIKIDGDTLEAMVLDPNRPQLYVNNREKNQVQVVNRYTHKLMEAWPVTKGKTNVTMAYDVAHHRLFVGCRSGQLVVFDTDSGKELQALPIVKGVDDTAFDESTGRIYSAGDGAMSVYQEVDPDHYKLLGDVPTGPLGKTARLSPELDRMYIAVPQHGTTDPEHYGVQAGRRKGFSRCRAARAPVAGHRTGCRAPRPRYAFRARLPEQAWPARHPARREGERDYRQRQSREDRQGNIGEGLCGHSQWRYLLPSRAGRRLLRHEAAHVRCLRPPHRNAGHGNSLLRRQRLRGCCLHGGEHPEGDVCEDSQPERSLSELKFGENVSARKLAEKEATCAKTRGTSLAAPC